MTTIADLADLAGSELSGVCFVRDYVELHFDGPVLRCLAPPVVVQGGGRLAFPDAGSGDALRGLIGRVVERASDEADRLVVQLAGHAVVEIPKASRGAGPEIAHFVPIRDGRRDGASMMTWENLESTHERG